MATAIGAPAAAHTCTSPATVEPGKQVRLDVGVGAEFSAATEVRFEIPPEFAADGMVGEGQWTAAREGNVFRMTGGRIPPFGCAYFALTGTAKKRATFAIPMVVKAEDGTETEYRSRELGDVHVAQIVFAGTQSTGPSEDNGKPRNWTPIGVVGILAAGAVWFWWSMRRPVPPDDASLGAGQAPPEVVERDP